MDYGVTLALTQHAAGLKPGESVSVSVITAGANNALSVPATAATTAGTTSTVVVVGANNTERTVPVTLGIQGSTDDQILTGLTLGGAARRRHRGRHHRPLTPTLASRLTARAADFGRFLITYATGVTIHRFCTAYRGRFWLVGVFCAL